MRMWLVVSVYIDGMVINVDKFKTKGRAIKYLESLGFKKRGSRGRVIHFDSYGSYAEIIPEDEIKFFGG